MRDFPVRAWVYAAAVAAAGCGAVLHLMGGHGFEGALLVVAFGVMFSLAEMFPVRLPAGPSYSVSYVIVVAALIVLGPAQAAVVAAFGAFPLNAKQRPDWLGRAFFNAGQLMLSTAAAAFVYTRLGGPSGGLGSSDVPWIFVPLAVSSFVYFLVNTSAVTGMVTLVRRAEFRDVWMRNYLGMTAGNFAWAVLGVLFAVSYQVLSLPGILFILLPLLLARHAFQAAATMNDAYERTLRSLVTAIEAKDAYTRGHAERVSEIAALTARELGLRESRVRQLRIAALMHDVGKLVVATPVLTKPGKLTPEEYEHMKAHPIHGCEIVEEIDFLREGDAVDAVRHHHERMDGKGYPDGIAGDEIPIVARIVMVADAFDSMTSTRSYRKAMPVENALAELRRCQDTQFDRSVIDALERAVAKHGWEPSPEAYEGEQTPRPDVSVHAAHA